MTDPRAFALSELDRLMTFFPRVDGKATYLFTLNLALLGLVAVNFPYREAAGAAGIAGGLCVILTLTSCAALFRAFFPNLTGGDVNHSVLYFGSIATISSSAYRDRLKQMTDDELLDDETCQVHRNSEILLQKFSHVQIASYVSTMSAGAFVTFLALAAAAGLDLKWSL